MNHLFKSHKLQLDIKKFLLVARTSIKLREEAKLIFTKGINEVFVNLIKLGKEMKISRDDLQFLSIKEFENRYQNLDINKLSKILKKNIQQNKKDFKYLKYINLPDIIISPKCVYQFEKSQVKGNFITNKIINGNILNYTNIINKKLFINKIVLIENADPGFDFLFGLGIKGLITQYGGANSHMAIRCLEENIPACIGIGEKSFDIIKKSKVIELNCFQDNYKILS
jgi:phosphoenolpyruvate-protein kinase (PTS system EI component)